MLVVGSTISGSDRELSDGTDVITSPWEEDAIDLPGIIDDSERVRALWSSPAGVVRDEGDEQRQVEATVVLLVSDRRILFVARGDGAESPAGTYSLAYGDLAGVDADGEQLALRTTGGVVWRVPLPSETSPDVETVLAHLRWIGELRSRLVRCGNDVELAAGEIREHAHALDWDRARTSYEEVRERLDALICDVQLVEPVATAHLAPELTEIERQLERAHTRLYIERAKAALAMGRHLVESEEYEGARQRLREAQQCYDRALAQSDAVKRGDAFQFGPQRELQYDLENLGWEIETVAAEPIKQAHEAKIEAQFVDDPGEALEHWEAAFRRYGNVLTLEWDDDGRNFAGDPAEVRRDRASAAREIVRLRRELARREWNEGARLQNEGSNAAALDRCTNAVDHLERGLELAEEFEAGDPAAMAGRLDGMRAVVDELSERVARGPVDDEGGDRGSPGLVDPYEETRAGDVDREASGSTPSMDGLENTDVHHGITLEATRGSLESSGEDGTDDETRGEEPGDSHTSSDDARSEPN